MEVHVGVDTIFPTSPVTGEEHGMGDVKKGPWTDEEDEALLNYVRVHGEGRWNSVAHYAGLKRTGKSCRLRWLNYLRPDVRRGNITLEEQLMILDLHSRWGNRWSKIAKYLPGRTDNEIKNYWRTRVQKQAKQLNCDVNSRQFQDAMRYVWIPRMMERVQANSSKATSGKQTTSNKPDIVSNLDHTNFVTNSKLIQSSGFSSMSHDPMFMPEMSGATSDSSGPQNSSAVSNHSEFYSMPSDIYYPQTEQSPVSDNTSGHSDCWTYFNKDQMFDVNDDSWFQGAEDQSVMLDDNFWNIDNIGFLQRQLSDDVL